MSEAKSAQGNRVRAELEQLRQKQLAKNRRDKLKDLCGAPLTTPEEAQAFLAAMRDKSHQREMSHLPPSNISADGMDAWFQKQKQREKELRQRRREAEALLRGYRASGEFINNNNSNRASLGGGRYSSPAPGMINDGMGSPEGAGRGGAGSPGPYCPESPVPTSPVLSPYRGMEEEAAPEMPPREDVTSPMRTPDRGIGSPSRGVSLRLSVGSGASESLDDPRTFRSPHTPEYDPADEDDQSKKSLHVQRGEVSEFGDGGGPAMVPMLTAASSEEEKKHEEQHSSKQDAVPTRGIVPRGFHNSSKVDPGVEPTIWRDFISTEPGAKYPPEPGRYHLYLSYACPGSHRVLIVRALKGLEDAVSVTFVHPIWRLTNPDNPDDKHRGWVFGDPCGQPFTNTIGRGGPFPAAYKDNQIDPIMNAFSIRELYHQAEDTSGKYTIPLLWDMHNHIIVNNDSSDIAYMLNSCFNDHARNPSLDLYTEDDEDGVAKLNEVSEWLSPLMIHGVYRCGFAKNQHTYDKSIAELCAAFDRADDILQQSRYLTGDMLTDADIRLFVTLIRFDEVYAFYFRANARLVMLTPSLLDFCREIYQIPGIRETCNMEQIKAHFYGSHAEWNKYSVIPRGLGFMELLEMPHGRTSGASSSSYDEIDRYDGTQSYDEEEQACI